MFFRMSWLMGSVPGYNVSSRSNSTASYWGALSGTSIEDMVCAQEWGQSNQRLGSVNEESRTTMQEEKPDATVTGLLSCAAMVVGRQGQGDEKQHASASSQRQKIISGDDDLARAARTHGSKKTERRSRLLEISARPLNRASRTSQKTS